MLLDLVGELVALDDVGPQLVELALAPRCRFDELLADRALRLGLALVRLIAVALVAPHALLLGLARLAPLLAPLLGAHGRVDGPRAAQGDALVRRRRRVP